MRLGMLVRYTERDQLALALQVRCARPASNTGLGRRCDQRVSRTQYMLRQYLCGENLSKVSIIRQNVIFQKQL